MAPSQPMLVHCPVLFWGGPPVPASWQETRCLGGVSKETLFTSLAAFWSSVGLLKATPALLLV